MLTFDKKDSHGQVLQPGYVCVTNSKSQGLKFCIYKKPVINSTKGEYGKFITEKGTVTLKFTSVVFVFDPISDGRSRDKGLAEIIRRFYEDIR